MTTEIAPRPIAPELTPFEVMERVISSGDIGRMEPRERVAFYWRTCETLGLNPMTQPFSYLSLNGKVVLYARKDATEQLRRVNRVSVTELRRERDEAAGTYTVYAHGKLPDGREDEASGIVSIKGLSGETLANAMMKAETKAKRRLTLSLVGLGFLDESEIEGLGDRLDVDITTGEIVERAKPASLIEQVQRQTEQLVSDDTTLLAAPMTLEASAEIEVVGIEEEVVVAVVEEEPEEELLAALDETKAAPVVDEVAVSDVAATAPTGALTIQQLADLARDAGVGKMKFAIALECVPADVGKRIEAMSDAERYLVAVALGLVA